MRMSALTMTRVLPSAATWGLLACTKLLEAMWGCTNIHGISDIGTSPLIQAVDSIDHQHLGMKGSVHL